MEEREKADCGACNEGEFERRFFKGKSEIEDEKGDGESKGKVALVGEDIKIPESAGNDVTIVRAEGRKGGIGKNVFQTSEVHAVVFKICEPTEGTIKKKEEEGEDACQMTFKKPFSEKVDGKGEEGKTGGAWQIEGKGEGKVEFFEKADQEIENEMVADGRSGEEGELGWKAGEVFSQRKGADEGNMGGEITPSFTGDNGFTVFYGESLPGEPGGSEEAEEENTKVS